VWEFNAAFSLGIHPSPVTGTTHAQGITWPLDLRTRLMARRAPGRPTGDVLLYTGGICGTTGTGKFPGTWRQQVPGARTASATRHRRPG
jgi:hypothetical protein